MIEYDTPDANLPKELKDRIEAANAPVVHALHERLKTPVPGNPHGGFPGINLHEHRSTLTGIRRRLIDQWNAENPNHEAVDQLVKHPRVDVEALKAQAREGLKVQRVATAQQHKLDHTPHVDKFLADFPGHRHEELRAFIDHERELDYDHRCDLGRDMKAAGKDPHDLEHRLQHHKENGLF